MISLLRKINRYYKVYKKKSAGKYLSPVRRIEKVHPLKSRKVCAMTFDDGPNALLPEPLPKAFGELDLKNSADAQKGLTQWLLYVLTENNAHASFDFIASTGENYPDEAGEINTPHWGGIKHDHYPDFGKDEFGGILNQPQIARELLDKNIEIANHSGRHRLFGRKGIIYKEREFLGSIDAVLEDLCLNHNAAYTNFGYTMKLSRPPHYVDGIDRNYDSYDAYAMMGYQYMAASIDGGGWMPSSGDYEADVKQMVDIMNVLDTDPEAFSGHIIFQKDGYNMSKQTPIADALDAQLKKLSQYGYEVLSVSELLELSPFEDFGEGMSGFESARNLVNAGYICAYKNNTFQPERRLSYGELIAMLTPVELYTNMTKLISEHLRLDFDYNKYDVKAIGAIDVNLNNHPYELPLQYAVHKGYVEEDYSIKNTTTMIDTPVTKDIVIQILSKVCAENGVNKAKLLKAIQAHEEVYFKRHEITDYICISLNIEL